jgi:PAS domain S-box-containing protein
MFSTELMLRELVEHAHDLIFCLHPDGTFAYSNRAWKKAIGCTEQELSKRVLFDFIHKNSLVHCQTIFGRMLDGRATDRLQLVIFVPQHGGSFAAEGNCDVLFKDGIPTLIRGIFRDVTERRALEREVLSIGVRERQRLARDLHDGLGQELTGASLLVSSLTDRLAESNAPESECIRDVASTLNRAIGTMRDVVHGLYPLMLEEGDLKQALQTMSINAGRISDISCRFEGDEDPIVLSDDTAMHLYYIASEAVNNAIKHANARSIVVRLQRKDGKAVLQIIDDGVGIAEGQQSGGSGLRSMRYRSDLIGWLLELSPGPDGGTVITCAVDDECRVSSAKKE